QHAALAQHTAPLLRHFAAQIDAPELLSRDPRNAVMPRQGPVEKGERGIDEIQDAAVLVNDGIDKELGLAANSVQQLVIDSREALRVRPDAVQIAKLQPLG